MTSARGNLLTARRELDQRLTAVPGGDTLAVPKGGWIRAIRDAMGMTAAQLGARMGISQPSVVELERNERSGTIRFESLRRAAAALDCTLVYAFVPNGTLGSQVRAQAERVADEDLARVDRSMSLEDQSSPASTDAREELIRQLIESRRLWDKP